MESLVKERVQKKKAKSFFVCVLLKEKNNFFYPKEERASMLQSLKNIMKKHWR